MLMCTAVTITITEVVVPRFRGELTLLGSGAREGGGGTMMGSPHDLLKIAR